MAAHGCKVRLGEEEEGAACALLPVRLGEDEGSEWWMRGMPHAPLLPVHAMVTPPT